MSQILTAAELQQFEHDRSTAYRRMLDKGMLPSEAIHMAAHEARQMAEARTISLNKVLPDSGGPLSGQNP